MLSVPHLKFCEGIITGLCRSAAYAAAFPSASRDSARSRGSRLYRQLHIQAEIARMRGGGPRHMHMAGSALLSHVEMRAFLAQVVRGELGTEEDSCTSEGAPASASLKGETSQRRSANAVSIRDRLLALKLASAMTPMPDPEVNAELEAFRDIIRRVRSRPWRPPEAPPRNINPHQASSPQVDGPPMTGPQVSGPELNNPQVSGPQVQGNQASAPAEFRRPSEASATAPPTAAAATGVIPAISPAAATAEANATSPSVPAQPAAVARSNERYVQDFPSPIPPGYTPPRPRPRPRPSGRYRSVVGKHTCR